MRDSVSTMLDNKQYREFLTSVRKDLKSKESRLHELKDQLLELEHQLSEFKRLERSLSDLLGEPPESVVVRKEGRKRLIDDPLSPIQRDAGKPAPHADVAKDVLTTSGRSMSIQEIIDGIIAEGHALPAAEKQRISAVYSAMLRRPHVFRRLGGGKWGLVGRDTAEED